MTDTTAMVGLRTIARDSVLGWLGALGVIVLNFATKMLLARALTSAELGILLTGQTMVGLALAVAQLSLPEAVVRFVGLYAPSTVAKAKATLLNALKLSTLVSLLMAGGLGLGAGFIANRIYQLPVLAGVLILLAVAMPFTSVADVLAATYRGLKQLWVKVICVDLTRALGVVLMLVVLMSQGANTLPAVAGSYVLATILSAFLTFALFRSGSLWRVSASHIPTGELLRYSLPLLAAGLLAGPIVNTGLPLLLGGLGSAQAVAYYSLAVSLQLFVYLPIAALEQAALPIWSGQIGVGTISGLRASYAFFTRWGYVVASVVFALLFFNARTVLVILYGPEYAVAALAIQALGAMTLFGAAVGPNEGMLRALGDTRWIFFSRLVAGVASLGAAILLIPQWGLMGAVMAFIVSGLLINGLYAAGLFWQHAIHPLDGPYLKTLAASFIAFLSIGFARPYLRGGFAGIGMSTALYAILLVVLLHALRAFTAQDARALNGVYQQIRGFFSKKGGPDAVR